MRFRDLRFEPHPRWAGVRARVTFPNGYGASVIRARGRYGGGSYGVEQGLYELAVLGRDGYPCCDTPVRDGVLGYLSEAQVETALAQIEALDSAPVRR